MDTFDSLKQVLDECERKENGVFASDIAALPESLRAALNKIMRQTSMTLSDLKAELGLELEPARLLANLMIEKGFLKLSARQPENDTAYEAHLARKRGSTAPLKIWQAIDE
ncbi:MAG: hypothetical protein HYZ49_20835 [Chloroflexi bacterium]|nr:hypothetical protein [Chloroflexota bacterium]